MHRAMLLFIAITLHDVPEGGSLGLVAGSAALSGEPAELALRSRLRSASASRTFPKAPPSRFRLQDKA